MTWKLAPNMFSNWGKVSVPADAVFTVTVRRLDGPDGKDLFGESSFDDADVSKLAELEAKYK